MSNPALAEWAAETKRKYGLVSPKDEGFFGEMFKGACYSTYKIMGWDMHGHLDWRRPAPLSAEGMCGRILGEGWFITLPLLIIGLLIFYKKSRKRLKAYQEYSDKSKVTALEELESGEVDKATWAKAMIKTKGCEEKAKAEYLRIRKL